VEHQICCRAGLAVELTRSQIPATAQGERQRPG
jgi:hypothetical protein